MPIPEVDCRDFRRRLHCDATLISLEGWRITSNIEGMTPSQAPGRSTSRPSRLKPHPSPIGVAVPSWVVAHSWWRGFRCGLVTQGVADCPAGSGRDEGCEEQEEYPEDGHGEHGST